MKTILFEIKQKIVFLVRAFYSFLNGGEKCIVCGQYAFVLPICTDCRNKYFDVANVLNQERCKKCGKPLISSHGICMECREETVLNHVDQMLPLFPYLMWNKEVLFLWKITGVRSLSSFFAKKVSEVLHMMDIQFVVPVPPRPGKIKKNGWDQVDELCSFLEYRYGFKVVKLLERCSTQQQKKLNRQNRLEKIESAYSVASEKQLSKEMKSLEGILPEKVCLIDDVCTTGATIEKCAALLKEMGVKKISAITLFVV